MIVTVSTRHMEVSAAMKAYAEQKAGKLTKYYDRIQEIEVVFDAGRDKTSNEKVRVEFIVTAEHNNRFIAHDDTGDAYSAVDACVAKLERQLSEHKKMFRNRKHDVGEDKREMHIEGSTSEG